MFEVVVVEKTSKKGNSYTALEIIFPNGYKKLIFLDEAEKYMVKQ